MMKKLLYLLGSAMLLVPASCTRDSVDEYPFGRDEKADGFAITLAFPDMGHPASRAIGGTNPALKELDLYLFVFDGASLSQTIHLDENDIKENGYNETDNRVTYKVNLPQTTDNAVVHIVALDDSDGAFAAQIERIGYGLEDTVIPALSVSGEADALPDVYWQRVDIGCPIQTKVESTENPDLNRDGTEDQVRNVFSHPIPLVRNFARITLSIDPGIQFVVKGWTVVNALDASAVAPWYSPDNSADVDFARFVDLTDASNTPFTYDEVTKQGYKGVNQSGASLLYPSSEDVEEMEEDAGNDGEHWVEPDTYIYLYERRDVSVNPLYLLVYGYYVGNDGGAWGYYKLNLGKTDDETGLFTPYNVIRNMDYSVVIKSVTAPGYKTPKQAAVSPAFNNVSADVNTKNMLNISDGIDMLYVNFVNRVVTSDGGTEVEFKYRYITNVLSADRNTHNEMVYVDYVTSEGELIGLPDTNDPDYRGDVIESWTKSDQDETDEHGLVWRTIKIKTYSPTFELKQQSFTIFSKPAPGSNETIGLSKKVTLMLRQPWDFVRMETFPGIWNDDTAFPDYDPDDEGGLGWSPDEEAKYYVGSQKGAGLTVFFELPAGLPEAVFPMEFTLESDRQNIENAAAGNAVVQTGQSLFPDVTDPRISFVKRVTWQDYAPNGETSTPESRIIRARFITTTDIFNLQDDSYISTVRLYNPYFNIAEDKFERSQYQFEFDDPNAEMPKDMIWDFSSSEWDPLFSSMPNTGSRYFDTEQVSNRIVDGLTVSQNFTTNTANYWLTNGTDEEGERYIAASRSNSEFTFSVTFPPKASANRAVLRITAAEDRPNADSGYHNVNMTVSASSTVYESAVASDTSVFTTKRTRSYEYVIPGSGGILGVTIKPGGNYNNGTASRHNALRIYKIEFYPTGIIPEDAGDSSDSGSGD